MSGGMNSKVWRLLDTGTRRAAENMALNRALLTGRQQKLSPDTLRFLAFTPSALLGYHQSAEQELNLARCHDWNIAVQRRITGGGAIYMDEGQLGWELYLDRQAAGSAEMSVVARRICEAAARGLQALDIEAMYRPRNDIEVHGRKISGTGGAFDGDALMYQGTLLIDFDVERMLSVLNIPAGKLTDKAIASARDRVTSLSALLSRVPERASIVETLANALSEEFGVTLEPGGLNTAETALYEEALAEIDSQDWVNMVQKPAHDRPVVSVEHKFPAGMLRVNLAWDRQQDRIRQVWFSGDVFISPARTLVDLESCLRDTLVNDMPAKINEFFAERQVDMLGLQPDDIIGLLAMALKQENVA